MHTSPGKITVPSSPPAAFEENAPCELIGKSILQEKTNGEVVQKCCQDTSKITIMVQGKLI